jgi:(p)ppGpp synthase/HD superfamily hydrolase
VAMETIAVLSVEEGWDGDLVVQCALLHDVLEDTDRSDEGIEQRFGKAVADGVRALTRDGTVKDRRAQILENLERIRRQPWEIWMVKMADRIANLQPPPKDWTPEHITAYREESRIIHRALGKANSSLADRLAQRIANYPKGPGFLHGDKRLA